MASEGDALGISRGRRCVDLCAPDALARVACWLTTVILVGVDDEPATDKRPGIASSEVGAFTRHLESTGPIGTNLDVAEIAEVTWRLGRQSVIMTIGVEMAASARTVGCAAIGPLMEVHSVLARRHAGDVDHDDNPTLGRRERHGS